MIAEDEADIRNLLLLMIQVWGHQATAYENGQKVWEWLDELERDTAAVITDAPATDVSANFTDARIVPFGIANWRAEPRKRSGV